MPWQQGFHMQVQFIFWLRVHHFWFSHPWSWARSLWFLSIQPTAFKRIFRFSDDGLQRGPFFHQGNKKKGRFALLHALDMIENHFGLKAQLSLLFSMAAFGLETPWESRLFIE